jgi:pyruvate/2-oxoglutarate dehydrogenase complex dihydrolipoamide acyltransferase (E2) component
MPKVTMPQLGESVAEGTIGKWLKNVGDHVDKYEPIVEVITDKVNAEVPSPFAGTLSAILVQEGETVPNDTEIAVIEATGEDAAAEPAAASPGGAASADAPAAVAGAEAVADEVQAGEGDASGPETGQSAASGPGGGHGPAGSDERPASEPAGASTATAAPPAAPATAPAATVTAPSGSSTAGSNGAGDVAGYTGRMTPAVRRLAREHAVDLSQIAGSGHDGRVTRDDIMKWVESGGASAATSPSTEAPQTPATAAAASPAASSAPAPASAVPAPAPSSSPAPAPAAAPGAPAQDELKPMTPMRKAIARHMVESKSTAPHAYTTVEVDMFGVVALRDSVKRQYQEREGTALSFVAIVGKAVVEGLRRNPDLNAHWTEEGVMRRASVNLGVAVAVDDGLIVPVIKDADRYSIHGLNLWVQDYATRVKMDDVQGGTFTLNNTGWFGSVSSQPIVNVPEIAILSMEAIVKRPVVVETPAGDTIGIRPMMNICVSFDHRGTDGAQIGRFVQDVKRWLESVDPQTPVW